MKVEIEDLEVRIKGKSVGSKEKGYSKFLIVKMIEKEGKDIFLISVGKDGFDCGVLPMVEMDADHVIITDKGQKRFVD